MWRAIAWFGPPEVATRFKQGGRGRYGRVHLSRKRVWAAERLITLLRDEPPLSRKLER